MPIDPTGGLRVRPGVTRGGLSTEVVGKLVIRIHAVPGLIPRAAFDRHVASGIDPVDDRQRPVRRDRPKLRLDLLS